MVWSVWYCIVGPVIWGHADGLASYELPYPPDKPRAYLPCYWPHPPTALKWKVSAFETCTVFQQLKRVMVLRTCLKLSFYVEETDWFNLCNLEVFDTIIYTIQFNIPACIFRFMCPKVDISAPLPKGKLSNKIKKGTMVNEGRVHLRFGIPCFGRTGQRKVYTPTSDMGCLALLRVVQQILVVTLDISVLLQKS